MAQLFSGYARGGNFQRVTPYSRASAITSGTAYVRNAQNQMLDQQRRNAAFQHEFLQRNFQLNTELTQKFEDLELESANTERQLKQQKYEAEMDAIRRRSEDKRQLLESISGISQTATDLLIAERKKVNDAQLTNSQDLVIQYGLTGQELQELQTMEQTLVEMDAQQSPVLQRLRNAGASEADIRTLQKRSGYNAYGAALGVVLNSKEQYDSYLTAKRNEEVPLGNQVMSLSSAEAAGDINAITGLFAVHRQNFIKGYMPGMDPTFIAKHAREGFIQAESRRKRSIATSIEKKSVEANRATEQKQLLIALKNDPINGYSSELYRKSGGLSSSTLGVVGERQHELFVELVNDSVVRGPTASKVLNAPIFAKHLNKTVPYKEAFPIKANEIQQAIDKQEEDRLRFADNKRKESIDQGKALMSSLVQEFVNDPTTINDRSLDQAAIAVMKTGYIEGANKIQSLKKYSTEKTNDREFDTIWSKQKALGVFPTTSDILFSKLSPNKMTVELQQRKDFEDTGLSDDVMGNADKRINSMLRTALGAAYGSTQRVPPESLIAASANAKREFIADFRTAYKGDPVEAERYAIGEFKKELDQPEGLYKLKKIGFLKNGEPSFETGFVNFAATAQPKKVSPLPAIANAHKNGVEAFRSELYVDTGRVKQYVTELNQGNSRPIPSEIYNISKSLKGTVPLSEIITSQIELARQADPSIPEFNPEVKNIFEQAEQTVSPKILSIIQRYNTPATVDRNLVSSDIPSIYDRSNPYVSFGQMLEQVGVEEKFIPTFAAIMMGESTGRAAIDTAASGLDPLKLNEYSIGLMQINTKAHMDKLDALGYTMEDLRNPVKNLRVAMLVWDEWIDVLMRQGMSLEEAKVQALDRWGAYRDGRYKEFLEEAEQSWQRHNQQKVLPTWQRTENMNRWAQQWIDQNGGAWAR